MMRIKDPLKAVPMVLFCLWFGACSFFTPPLEKTASDEKTRVFNVWNVEKNESYPVSAIRLADNDLCIVYWEQGPRVDEQTARNIAGKFSQDIYPVISETFGDYKPVASDGRIVLLLVDIQDGYTAKSGTYIGGFFDPRDMFKKNEDNPHSNEVNMLYMDTYPQKPGSAEFFSTLAHEFQHMINFSQGLIKGLRNSPRGMSYAQETWMDEGLATAAEYIYTKKHNANWINEYNRDNRGSLRKGNTFYVWQNNENIMDEYMTAYFFFQWLRIHAGNGTGIYRDIITSPYADYRAVTEAAAKNIDPRFSSWETLLKTWFLANYVNYQPTKEQDELNWLGYKKEITLKPWAIGGPSQDLYPGEGVYSTISGSFSPGLSFPDSCIRYAGVTKNGEVKEAETLTGDRLLTFNANTDNWDSENSQETGRLTNGAAEIQSPSRQVEAAAGPFPIDYVPALRNLPLTGMAEGK